MIKKELKKTLIKYIKELFKISEENKNFQYHIKIIEEISNYLKKFLKQFMMIMLELDLEDFF